jgi:hypothetical protein
MIISYGGRLICVAVFMGGLIHVLVEGFLWAMAPFALRMADALSTRRRERLLYAIQLAPVFAAVILTGAVCIPQYVRSETNLEPESVGWLCVAGTVAMGIWYGFSLIRGLAVAARTVSFVRSCRRESNDVPLVREDMPILSYPGKAYSVALVGLFHPFILISESLLGEGGLSPIALDIVLDHEVSHARQLDNWKLFSLYCLPSLQLRLRNGQTWTQMWQSAAEWAADDDAVRSDNSRLLVLAETLVAVARRPAQHPNRVCMALASGEADLAARVSRLIDGPNDAAASHSWSRVCSLAVGLAGLVGALAAVMLSSHALLERLIHFGQA